MDFSERWLAYQVGTKNTRGADPQVVAQHLRKIGTPLETEWPSANISDFDKFYVDPPQYTYPLAKKFVDQYDLGHDIVPCNPVAMKAALKTSPLGISVRFDREENGIYRKENGGPDNHWVTIYGYEDGKYWKVFDSAAPFLKKLDWNHQAQLVKRYTVTKRTEAIQISLMQRVIALLTQLRDLLLSNKLPNAVKPSQTNATAEPAPTPSQIVNEAPEPFKWATPAEARHSIRLICDKRKLSLKQKNDITAVIQAESGFKNSAKCLNKNKQGIVTSTDWGICQINDTKGWHIGPGLAFKDVADVLDHPEKQVNYMITMMTAGKLHLWVAFKSGAYKKYLP